MYHFLSTVYRKWKETMNKKDLFITLQNIDEKLRNALEIIIESMSLQTINLKINNLSTDRSCSIVEICICTKSKQACYMTKSFFDEYRELNKKIQHLIFKYMNATNSFIEFKYGKC